MWLFILLGDSLHAWGIMLGCCLVGELVGKSRVVVTVQRLRSNAITIESHFFIALKVAR